MLPAADSSKVAQADMQKLKDEGKGQECCRTTHGCSSKCITIPHSYETILWDPIRRCNLIIYIYNSEGPGMALQRLGVSTTEFCPCVPGATTGDGGESKKVFKCRRKRANLQRLQLPLELTLALLLPYSFLALGLNLAF
jgi:hypothetical protein